jgi:hypothetical protein
MKKTVDWDEIYMLNLPPGEHDWVEFKGTASLDFTLPKGDENKALEELSKQLSAFANSGGGTLVYGIKDAPSGQVREVDRGGVNLALKGRSTKEWLEDVIPNLVDLPLSSFNVYTITNTGAQSNIDDGKGMILIEINDSEQAPHQARDKRYYARVSGKSKPISHRMVLDIMGRATHPKMDLSLKFVELSFYKGKLKELYLQANCINNGRIYANYVNGYIQIRRELVSKKEESTLKVEDDAYTALYFKNLHKDLVDLELGMPPMGGLPGTPHTFRYVTRYDPVLPGLNYGQRFQLSIKKGEIARFNDEILKWVIHADNMPPEKGEIKIKDLSVETIVISDDIDET